MNQNFRIILIDKSADACFGPLTELRQPGDLRCGAFTLREKLQRRFRKLGVEKISGCGWAAESDPHDDGATTLFLSDRTLLTETGAKEALASPEGTILLDAAGRIAGFRAGSGAIPAVNVDGMLLELATSSGRSRTIDGACRVDYPWEIVSRAGAEIELDMQLSDAPDGEAGFAPTGLIVRGKERLEVGSGVRFSPGVILDAEVSAIRIGNDVCIEAGAILSALDGPVWIAERARIMPGAILTGPVYVGADSIVRQGARLNGDVILGPQCRVGGELGEVVMQAYSNKQHSGYLGTSFIGEWVNLGAATDNSDLKNNYRPIEVTLNGRKIVSGELHAGVYLGDYVRSAIQTRLNSGTAVGTCCNLFGADFPEKSLPPFVWAASDGYQEYNLEKAIETIRVVMSRRKTELSSEREADLRRLFEKSAVEREQFLRKNA